MNKKKMKNIIKKIKSFIDDVISQVYLLEAENIGELNEY